MATINGAEGMSDADLTNELDNGARLVVFEYTISVLIMTFKRPSGVFLIRKSESALLKGLPYTLLTLLGGWWGIPWGPIYSATTLFTNLGGGKDITASVRARLSR